jgi:hypothetical protein
MTCDLAFELVEKAPYGMLVSETMPLISSQCMIAICAHIATAAFPGPVLIYRVLPAAKLALPELRLNSMERRFYERAVRLCD